MNATHTPGPWHVETWSYMAGKKQVPTVQTDKDAITQVCDLWSDDPAVDRTAERDANARLIAAAPAMHALLERFDRFHTLNVQDRTGVFHDARALLATIDGKETK